jgi:hypothetical protein
MSQLRRPDANAVQPVFDRRTLLARSAGALAVGLASCGPIKVQAAARTDLDASRLRNYLRPFIHKREEIDAWLAGKAYPFCKYDPELGYLHIDRDFKEGVDGAICSYRYDKWNARRTIAYADKPCRINTYGNSFTSCEQVSDGETWQEYLAAHLGEPIRNFGIGGYSVYQAYLRMKREEQRVPAKYIIVNIFDHDHYRNLLSWQRFRFGVNNKSPCPPVPHVKVDPDKGTFVEVPNPCPTNESLYRLCDLEEAYAALEGDYSLQLYAARDWDKNQRAKTLPGSDDFDDVDYTRRALYATTRIVDKIEEYAAREKKQVLYVLSYAAERIKRTVKEGRRFDQSLVDFLDHRKLPYVDLLSAHVAESKQFSGDIDAYLARYFIGHYNPLGNFFCAHALKDKLVKMLAPPPPAYATK